MKLNWNLLNDHLIYGTLIAALGTSLACSPDNPRLQMPAELFQSAEDGTNVAKAKINRNLTVLFVIDDSESMEIHQRNLSRHSSRFVEAFAANDAIDFHIGVTTVYDSATYNAADYSSKFGKSPPRAGELRALKSGASDLRFVDRNTQNMTEVLKETLLVGVTELSKGGPQYEEVFTSVLGSFLDPELAKGPNKGFHRPGSHVAVIFLTDAEDTGSLDPNDVYTSLRSGLMRNDSSLLLLSYGIIIPSSYDTPPRLSVPKGQRDGLCLRDFGNEAPKKIENFVLSTGGKILDLCSPNENNFATTLREMGEDLVKKIESDFIISLKGPPPDMSAKLSDSLEKVGFKQQNEHPLLVWYENAKGEKTEIAPENYSYLGESKQILLRPEIVREIPDGANIHVYYKQVNLKNSMNGQLKFIGGR